MNALLCTPCLTTDADLDAYSISDSQEDFATRPMQAIERNGQLGSNEIAIDEEALHSSFEKAISARVEALNICRDFSGLGFIVTEPLPHTAPKHATANLAGRVQEDEQGTLFGNGWQRNVAYICMALMLMLVGFDFMGLLFLHLH